MSLIKFLTSRTFFINVLIAILLGAGVIFGVYKWLDVYTLHGESITVPDLRGMTPERLESFLSNKQLNYKIIDSLYNDSNVAGTVLEQDPLPNSKVKENRTIYLTVNSRNPRKVSMPDLIDVSFRQAEAILQTFGLKTGQVTYKPDLARNAVLEQWFDGEQIPPGKEISQGSTIDLVLGDGIGHAEVVVPSLIKLTRGEALFVLKGSSLNIGTIYFDPSVRDKEKALVYKQDPEPASSIIKQGEAIDIYLR
jgi:beta-lactam-binding protein with PASTA domain